MVGRICFACRMAVRALLVKTGLPWIIENVPGSPLPRQDTLDGRNGLELCGTRFGLGVGRHRLFESSFPLSLPAAPCRCPETVLLNAYNAKSRERVFAEHGTREGDIAEVVWREEMGVPWMGRYEGREAVPPAYTEFIGTQLLAHLELKAAA